MHTILAAVRTAILVPLFFVFTIATAAVVFTILLIHENSPMVDRITTGWSKLFLRLGPLHTEFVGREHAPLEGSAIYVANHLSDFDIPLLFVGIPTPIRYMAKKELFHIPVLAAAMRRMGIIKVDRQGGGTTHHAAINRGVQRAIDRGHSIIVFPEGTRSRDGYLKPFKKGSFRIAVDNGLPVVPVTIHGTREAWHPGGKVIYPGKATLTIHEPIPTRGLSPGDIDEIRNQAHRIIEDRFESLRAEALQS